ncbi:MAG TPA: Rid family hydrolase [Acidimicrobiales bacterium]|nr:Rid family hydrolase [Acidimicrobiales bacterium]
MKTPVGPYSPWRRAGELVVISGQVGLDYDADPPKFVEGVAADQLRQALANAREVLAEAGVTFEQVFKATLFLVDMSDFASCNEVWVETFSDPRPTRSAVAVAQLPLGARAEVELWAHAPAG